MNLSIFGLFNSIFIFQEYGCKKSHQRQATCKTCSKGEAKAFGGNENIGGAHNRHE